MSRRAPLWAEEELAYLSEHYATVSAKDIAAHLGRTEAAVRGRASMLGLHTRQWLGGLNSLITDYFTVIDTPMKAWVLGLLTADGSISKEAQLRVELHRKDIEIVEAVRDELAPGTRIHFYNTPTTPMCRFMIGAARIRDDLTGHGIVNAKSLATIWPPALPAQFVNSFVCGVYDGDGSLGMKPLLRWSVVSGNPEFLQVLQAKIQEHTGVWVGGPYQDRRHEHAWSIIKTGRSVRALDEWIHRDVPGLTRKRLAESDLQPSLW